VHPVALLQLSMVQALLSLQTFGVNLHPVVLSQVSTVHSERSLQVRVVYLHPVTASQVSIVHAFPSSHVLSVILHPPVLVQEATWHASAVQFTGVFTHPPSLGFTFTAQVSTVHKSLSLQYLLMTSAVQQD
jgi:hypothetical protein